MDYPIKIKTGDGWLSDNEFFALCALNEDLRLERTADKEIVVMSPTYSESSAQNSDLIYQLQSWNRKQRNGVVFESNGGFILPNGAMRCPDAAWISKQRLENLPKEKKEKFIYLCPDFIIELRSKSDDLKTLQDKMQEWMDNGCYMAWLIDPQEKTVVIYEGPDKKIIAFGGQVTGGNILSGFELDYTIFESTL